MKKAKHMRFVALVMVFLMLVPMAVSCYPANAPATKENPDKVKNIAGGYWPAPPGFGGNLQGAQVGDPGSYIYESMFLVIQGTNKIIPRLAKEWTHEGNITTVKLVENRYWSDGTKFTAKDLYCHYMVNVNDAAINYKLEHIKVVDDYTLEFKWCEPVISDMQKMLFLAEGWQGAIPYHIFGEYVTKVEELLSRGTPYTGDVSKRPAFGIQLDKDQRKELKALFNEFKAVDMDMPIGTGPYMVDKVSNVECILKVNPYFPDGDKLEFQKLRMHTVSDYISLLSSGGTDSFIGTLPYDVSRTILDSNKNMVMYPLLEQKCIGVIFNTRRTPLNDPRVRKALNEVLEKKPIRQTANYWAVENDVATTGMIPSTMDKYLSQEVIDKFDRYHGDKEKAAQMMIDAGWKKNKNGWWEDDNGETYSFVIATNAGWGPQGITAATEIARQFTEFGFETEAKAVEATVVVNNMKEGLYDMLVEYLDMTWNISDPYKCFTAYYGDTTEKAGIDLSEPLILKDYDGKDINIQEAVDSLQYINDETEYNDLVGRIAWATNDNAIAINMYQNVMAIWESRAASIGLPMESEFDQYDRMMPLARTPEEYESIALLNRGYAPFAEVFIRHDVKPR